MRTAVRWITRALAAIGFLFVLATVTPIDDWWIKSLAGPWNDPKGDVLIVLGGDSIKDVIGWSSYWRSVYAVRAWREGGWRVVLISGGSSSGVEPAAERMGEFMMSQGIPVSVIRVETESHSTRENALKSKLILAKLPGHKVLMTSDYHMFRAARVFRKAGIDIEPRPLPDAAKHAGSWGNRWPLFLGLCVETAKIGYYSARGWI